MSDHGLMTMRNGNVFFHTDNSNTVCLGYVDIAGSTGSWDIISENIEIPEDKNFWYIPTILQLDYPLPDTEILAIVNENKLVGFEWGHWSRLRLGYWGNENNNGIRVYYGYY